MISVPVPTHISGVDGTICDAGRGLSSGRSIFSLRQQLPSEDKWTGHWMALLVSQRNMRRKRQYSIFSLPSCMKSFCQEEGTLPVYAARKTSLNLRSLYRLGTYVILQRTTG